MHAIRMTSTLPDDAGCGKALPEIRASRTRVRWCPVVAVNLGQACADHLLALKISEPCDVALSQLPLSGRVCPM